MFKKLAVGIMVLGLLFGCSSMTMKSPDEIASGNTVTVTQLEDGSTVTEYKGNTYATNTMEKVASLCYEAAEAVRLGRQANIAKLEDLQQTMAIMHSDTMDMIARVWGRDICQPGTNEFDATIAYYKEQGAFRTEVVRSVTGVTLGIVKWGAIGYGVGAIADNIGNGDRVGGDKTSLTSGNDQNITESTFTHSKSESNVVNTQVTGQGEQLIDNDGASAEPNAEYEEGTEEYCSSLGLVLRDSTGTCITVEEEARLDAAQAATE